MNLRQKAKYYKKKYQQNKVNYYDFSSFSAPIIQSEKIMAVQMMREEYLSAMGENADEMIANRLIDTMKEGIKRYMKVERVYYPEDRYYRYYGYIRFVKEV